MMKGDAQNFLNDVLPKPVDQPVALGIALQRVDGRVQIEFAGGIELGARPASQLENFERIHANLLVPEGKVHRRASSCSTLTQRK
jgi:hypothetical protein